MDGPCPHW